MLFISIRSSGAPEVPKVLQVVEETKRIRHKSGKFLASWPRPCSRPLGDRELYQYVLYDSSLIPTKGPKIINLDDNKGKGKGKDYTPPNNIVVHLSKIDMPELRPRASERTKDRETRESRKEREKKVKESSDKERKEMKKREKERATEKAKLRPKSSTPALASHHSPHLTSTSQRPPLHVHQSYPLQSSPVGYSAPPLPTRMPRPYLAPSSNRHPKYETYPVLSHNRRPSNQHNPKFPISPPPPPPPPPPTKLLDKLFGR